MPPSKRLCLDDKVWNQGKIPDAPPAGKCILVAEGNGFIELETDGTCDFRGCLRDVPSVTAIGSKRNCLPPSDVMCPLHTTRARCLSCARMVLSDSKERHVQECASCPGFKDRAFASSMITKQETKLGLCFILSKGNVDDFVAYARRYGIPIHEDVGADEFYRACNIVEASWTALASSSRAFDCIMSVPDETSSN